MQRLLASDTVMSIGEMDMEDFEVVGDEEEVDVSSLERATEDAPVVKLVNLILTDAIKKKASDIHIEPYERTFRVRYRIDGVLYEVMKPPLKLKNWRIGKRTLKLNRATAITVSRITARPMPRKSA